MIKISLQGRIPSAVSKRELTQAANSAFTVARKPKQGSLGICFVANGKMRDLNRTWRKKDKATDVLSFFTASLPKVPAKDWGDVIVAPSYVREQVRTSGLPFKEQLLRVTVHGVLHLMGFDHATKVQERRMLGLQERALKRATAKV